MSILWWVGGFWTGVGLALILLYVAVELFGTPARTWRQRFRDLALHLPLFFPLVVLGWPFLVLYGLAQIRRDLQLERACYGSPPDEVPTITELQWQRGSDAVGLLGGLPVPLSERKRRLIACACCRRVWDRIDDDHSRHAVELAERLADGDVEPDDVRAAAGKAGTVASALTSAGELEAGAAARAAQDCLIGDALSAARRTAVSRYRLRKRERRAQCEVLREIVGNPFRPLRPRDFAPELVQLAREIHAGDHALYPLLADALDDLGEHDAATHCRTGKHLRGCHVVDWVMGWA